MHGSLGVKRDELLGSSDSFANANFFLQETKLEVKEARLKSKIQKIASWEMKKEKQARQVLNKRKNLHHYQVHMMRISCSVLPCMEFYFRPMLIR